MTELDKWATDHDISREAVAALKKRLGALHTVAEDTDAVSEMGLQNRVRIAESKSGARLFRNNRGMAFNKAGRPVRFGLGNDSSATNKVSKSSDLIGVEPVIITQEMVGLTIGRFVSLEIKPPGWKYKGVAREVGQLNWINFIISMGGRAAFVASMADYEQKTN